MKSIHLILLVSLIAIIFSGTGLYFVSIATPTLSEFELVYKAGKEELFIGLSAILFEGTLCVLETVKRIFN